MGAKVLSGWALSGTAALLLVAALLVPWHGPWLPPAHAAVPTEEPTFTDPLRIDNSYFPVVPGAVKVYGGRDDGMRVTIVETHLDETREFPWDAETVSCRVVQRLMFEAGTLIEREVRYFAQADDGSVYMWGDVDTDDADEEEEEEEEEDDEPSGWIVGSMAEGDPEDVVEDAAPVLVMPAVPESGDLWSSENVAPWFLATCEVRNAGLRVKVHAGRYLNCIRVRSEDLVDGEVDHAWFAPGVGRVKNRGPGERLQLQASTIRIR